MSITITQPTTFGPPSAGAWATLDPREECRAMLHKKAFRLTHALVGHPLFSVEALVGAAQEASKRKRDVYMDAGQVSVTDKWGKIPVPDLPVCEVVKRIGTAGAWVIMKHVETDPRYKVVLDEWADFARSVAGPEASRLLRNPEMLVMVTSPNRVTPFHFDAEVNFLVQIQGSKDVWVCDPNDRTITTEAEIERYYAVTPAAGNYKPQAEDRATKFALSPGEAVHIPTHGAHWVKNHDNVSVSLSLNFEFPHWFQGDVYRANYYLRKLGLSPRPPGQSAIADRLKGAAGCLQRHAKRTAGTVYRSAKRLVRR